jgi:hypothetical protein
MASYNLQDGAQLWYIHIQETEGVPTWDRFKELLNLRYGPPLRSAPLFELSSCRRTGTVEEYQDRFQALLPPPADWRSASASSFSRGDSCLHSAFKYNSRTRRPWRPP